MEKFDIIIVGLGCVGISTAYYCAKKGLKVLGIEKDPKPGYVGNSSYGDTRLWRITHGPKFKNDMMKEALKLWKEIEEESGEKFVIQTPVLSMGSDRK
jgi:glycine/D-amino acid oxidase-like deaminating enzyme